MECRGCGNKEAYRIKTSGNWPDLKDVCDKCGGWSCSGKTFLPDVWYGYGSGEHREENIAYPKGHPNEGQPIPFHDKRSKKEAMRIAGVREAGDKDHGSRNESHLKRRTYG